MPQPQKSSNSNKHGNMKTPKILAGTLLALVPISAQAGTVLLDFETDPALSGATIAGDAEWRSTGGNGGGGYLSITDPVNGERGTAILADPTGGATIENFRIVADLRVGGGTDRPADGFSFNLARPSDPVLSGDPLTGWAGIGGEPTNLPEEGTTTGFSVGLKAIPSFSA